MINNIQTDSSTTANDLEIVSQPQNRVTPKIFWLLLLILIALSFGFVGYELGKSVAEPPLPVDIVAENDVEKLVEPVVDTQSDLNNQTQDDSLSKFQNLNGLAFSYPKNWYVEVQDQNSVRVQNYNPFDAPGRGYDPIADQGMTALEISNSGQTDRVREMDELINRLHQEDQQLCYYIGEEAGKTLVLLESNLGENQRGMKILHRITRCETAGLTNEVYYLLNGNGMIYEVRHILDTETDKDKIARIIGTISF